jgi:hypothetical protein
MRFTRPLKMVPILVGLAATTNAYASTEFAFNEKDIKNNLINIDLNTYALSKERSNFLFETEITKIRFNALYKQWQMETAFLSNVNQIIQNSNFKQLVSLGPSAVPYIIDEIKLNPSNLVWSLNLILNKRISKENVTVSQACSLWVKWWEKQSTIDNGY